jgi:hypothetical protein
MPTYPDYFTATCNGIESVGIDYIDVGQDPDHGPIYAFVWIIPRLDPGTTIWAPGLTPPRGIVLDPMQGRFDTVDGKLRTIIGEPTNEKQRVTVTGGPTGGTFTLTYAGQTTAAIPYNASPDDVQAALEALSNINVGDIYISGGIINEKQTVTVNGSPTGGSFTLTFGGYTTTPILHNATPSLVKAALQALPSIGGIGCSVTGPTGGPWIVEFTGTLAGQNVAQMTGGPRSETQVVTLHKGTQGGNFSLAFQGQTTAAIAYNASAATVQTALEALSNIAPGDVFVSGSNGGPYTLAFSGAYASIDVPQVIAVTRNTVQSVTISGNPTSGNFQLSLDGLFTDPIPYNAPASLVRTRLEELANIAPGDVWVGGNTGGPFTIIFQGLLSALSLPQLGFSHTLGGGSSPSVASSIVYAGIGLFGEFAANLFGTSTSKLTVATVDRAAALSGGTIPSIDITTTQAGSTGSPYTISFIGDLAGTDVAQITATPSLTGGTTPGVTIETVTPGESQAGIKLVANTALIEHEGPLIYDVEFEIPDDQLDDTPQAARVIKGFAFEAPTTGGTTIDFATVTKLPGRRELGYFGGTP